jgi:hypothetical protein
MIVETGQIVDRKHKYLVMPSLYIAICVQLAQSHVMKRDMTIPPSLPT